MVLSSPPSRERSSPEPTGDRGLTARDVPFYNKESLARKVNFVTGLARMFLVLLSVTLEALAINMGSHIKVFMFESIWNGVPLFCCGALGLAASRFGSRRIKTTHLISSMCMGCSFAAIQWGLAGSAWSIDETLECSPCTSLSAAVSLIGFLQAILNGISVSLNCAPVCCPDPDLSLLAVSTYGSSSRTNTTVHETTDYLPDHLRLLFDPDSVRIRFMNAARSQETDGASTPPPTPEEGGALVSLSTTPLDCHLSDREMSRYSDPPPSYEEVMRNNNPPTTPPPAFSDVT